MICSHNHCASTETLRQLFSKMEGMVNEHTPGQDFAVLMDMAPIHISAETKQVLQEEFGHIRVIMNPTHTTSFLQLCDAHSRARFEGRPARTTREPSTTTPMTSALSSTLGEPILSDSSRQECTHWSATEESNSLRSTCEAMVRCGARCSMKHANCMQLDSSSRMCGRNRRRCQRRWPCLPSPKSKIFDVSESNASTDVAQDHMRDPEVQWLEPLVEAPVATRAQRISHFLAHRLVWGTHSARDLQQAAACRQE